jgi:hypothetical protein
VPNPANPSLEVPFGLGFLQTDPARYALRVSDAQTASSVTTVYEGALPLALDNAGAVSIGVSGENSSLSSGTFYEAPSHQVGSRRRRSKPCSRTFSGWGIGSRCLELNVVPRFEVRASWLECSPSA